MIGDARARLQYGEVTEVTELTTVVQIVTMEQTGCCCGRGDNKECKDCNCGGQPNGQIDEPSPHRTMALSTQGSTKHESEASIDYTTRTHGWQPTVAGVPKKQFWSVLGEAGGMYSSGDSYSQWYGVIASELNDHLDGPFGGRDVVSVGDAKTMRCPWKQLRTTSARSIGVPTRLL